MKSGELFDKRKFPQLTGDAKKDIESLRRWAFNFADEVEQHLIKRENEIKEEKKELIEMIEALKSASA